MSTTGIVEWPFEAVIDFQEGPGILAKDFQAEGVPLIRLAGLDVGGSVLKGCNYLDPDMVAKKWSHFALKEGDILLSTSASLGRVAVVGPDAVGAIAYTGLIRMRPRDERLYAPFIRYLLASTDFQNQVRASGAGSVIQHFGPTHLRKMTLMLPPPDEQREIVAVLGALDAKIELNRRLSETLEAIAQALFQSWFVDFHPVRAKASGQATGSVAAQFGLQEDLMDEFPTEFIESEMGPIPEGWSLSTLGDQARRYGGRIQTGPFGSQLHASDYVDDGTPVVMPQDLVDRRIEITRIARISDEMATRLARHKMQAGDVVYSRRGDVERHALVGPREAGWLCGTGCLLVRLGDRWPSQAFLSEVLNHRSTREWLVRHAVGATMPNLNTEILSSVPILTPPERLLRHFESIAGNLRSHQAALSSMSEAIAALRDQLLPKLLSGELWPGNASTQGRG